MYNFAVFLIDVTASSVIGYLVLDQPHCQTPMTAEADVARTSKFYDRKNLAPFHTKLRQLRFDLEAQLGRLSKSQASDKAQS